MQGGGIKIIINKKTKQRQTFASCFVCVHICLYLEEQQWPADTKQTKERVFRAGDLPMFALVAMETDNTLT